MKTLFTLLCLTLVSFTYAQRVEVSDKSAYDFKVGQDYFKMSESEKIFKNTEALRYISKAKSNRTFALVFGSIGGAGLGYGAVRLLGAKKTEVYSVPGGGTSIRAIKNGSPDVLLAGVAFVVAAIPFAVAVKKNVKKAVVAENAAVSDKQSTASLSFGATTNGIVLNYQF